MIRRKRPELERSQESVWYIPDQTVTKQSGFSTRAKYANEFYPYMLIDDVRLSIMPIGGHSRNKSAITVCLVISIFTIASELHVPSLY